jgi:copper transport protein
MRLVCALVLLFISLAQATPVFAHASLLSADPADGTVLAKPPESLTLTFSEQVAPILLKLIAPDGRGLALQPNVEGPKVLMAAPTDLGHGTYALSWRVISTDGHPISGATTFSIGAPSQGGGPQEQENVDWPVRIGIWATRVLTYAGLFLGIGGIFFVSWFGNGAAGLRAGRAASIVGLAALVLSVGFQGLDVLDQPIASFFSSETWSEGIASSYGLFVGIVIVGFALALLAASPIGLQRLLSLMAFLCVGLSLAMTGHASTADPQWLTRPAVFVHTSVVAFWIGSLIPLAALLRGPVEPAVAPLRRFSATIPPLLLLLLVAGVALAVAQLGTAGELLSTDYGHVFIVKMVFVAVLLGLAAFNRWGLTGSVLADATTAQRHLARSISIELGLVFVILGIVALWRFTQPPRALLEAAAQPVRLEMMSGEGMAEMTIAPGHVGPVTTDIVVMGPNMSALKSQGVTVEFSNTAAGIEPIERQATLQTDGSWRIDELILPVAGIWQIEVDVLVSDFKQIDLTGQIDIRP